MSSAQDLSEITALVAKREKYFARLQLLYDVGKSCFELAKISKPYAKELESFTSRYQRIEDDYSTFEEISTEIERINNRLKDDDKIQTHQVSMSYDELYFNVKAQARKMNVEKDIKITASPAASNPTQATITHNRARLPELEIHSFDGSISDWPNFYSTFMTGIHNVKSLSKVEKFMYLRSYLKSHAFSLIETLDITDDNYDIAMKILIDRFQNKRLLASNYLDKIFSFRQLPDDSSSSYNKFLEVFSTSMSAFKALNISDPFDFAMLHLGVRALSYSARKEFENEHSDTDVPAFEDLMKFVHKQIKTSELTQVKIKRPSNFVASPLKSYNRTIISKGNSSSLLASTRSSNYDKHSNSSTQDCSYCQDAAHKLYACPKFKSSSVSERHNYVKRNMLCFCCLSNLHQIAKCKSNSKCRHCGKSHHSLLHFINEPSNLASNDNESNLNRPCTSTNVKSVCNVSNSNCFVNTVLSTAIIGIRDRKNNLIPIRAILDNGSQTCLITRDCAKKLSLPRRPNNINLLTAASNEVTQNLGSVSCTISPLKNSSLAFCSEAVVVDRISVDQPNVVLNDSIRAKYSFLSLADPCFDKPAPIDFLIGSDIYYDILDDSQSIIKGEPAAYATKFGWVIGGRLPTNQDESLDRSYFLTCCQSIDSSIRRFWEIEDIHVPPPVSKVDIATEDHFKRTHSRNESGRYIVALPLKNNHQTLPSTRQLAKIRLRNLESRLERNPAMFQEYRKFMDEYISSKHMSLASNPSEYIIPHHCVVKDTSSTTKLRVVFHASFSPQTGIYPSLNDILDSGPKLQRDICDVICKFRLGAIVLCADIKQMYRQVLVRQEDRYLQHIFYRTAPDSEIDEYELNTVTYGITSSAYQAIRVLMQLVEDEGEPFPNASKTISQQTFVDDICESVDTIDEAINLQTELIELLKLGGFVLRKWASNCQAVLDRVPSDLREQPITITSDNDSTLKILGLQYDSLDDSFSYSIKINPLVMSKRSMLSEIARIFDPLGWLTPLTFFAKHLMQQTWLRGLTWDETLPSDLAEQWCTLVSTLPSISKLRIPRHILIPGADFVHIIGFCDASEKGYAANIYLRSESPSEIRAHLLKAKSRVSPLKTISIPRLELCGAQLLKQLVTSIKPLIETLENPSIILFTDSSIVLSWIRTPPHKLKTFIANRVVDILEDTTPDQWKHVMSIQNPSDCASRGLLPESLVEHQLWWNGPDFLFQPINSWKTSAPLIEDHKSIPEMKIETFMITQQLSPSIIVELMNDISCLIKLQRILAVILRFIHNIQCLKKQLTKRTGRISPKELQDALFLSVKEAQQLYFAEEIHKISNNECTSKKYRPLAPFLDELGFLRVGGRLKYSKLAHNAKHPLLIPRDSRLATLICDYYHQISLHGGPRICQSLIQQTFWIIGIRQLLRQRIFKCQKCYLFQAKPFSPLMADLPSARFQDIRAFLNVGLDYAGPYEYKESHRRKAPRFKGYIVIFVCFATKAVHLEFATSLSTHCFLAALDRFVGRRGLCKQIHSDRGTNFIGASNYFTELQRILHDYSDEISDRLAAKQIKWNFNPPSSPHMGGLWEAAVKSVRHHLNRVLGPLTLTFEEMNTLLIRIEAILNSRPLGALVSDPNDGPYLSPGHFLIGSPLLSPPEPDVSNHPSNYLNRYELLQQAAQSFWKQWHQDYLHTLMKRNKWDTPQPNVKKGDIVYLKSSNSSPLEWPLGLIEEVFPGRDNIVRTVKIRTQQGTYVRPVHKLVALPPTDFN